MRSGSLSLEDGLAAKGWGLSDACKQVPLSDEAFHLDSYLAVYDPSCSPAKICKQCVLPFGSIASVIAGPSFGFFLQCGRWDPPSFISCGQFISTTLFVCLARRSSESKHVGFCVDALFSLLGWRISKNKPLEFNTLCKVLGVQLDLRQSGDRLCLATNTEERVEELVTELDEALRTKILSRSEGEKLRGRLQFASSQVFGRKFRRLLKVFSNHVTQRRKTLSQHTQSCLCDIRKLLTQNAPRKIEVSQAEVLHIYVDASFDYSDYSGLCGLIVHMSKKILLFFSTEVEKRNAGRSNGQRAENCHQRA